MANQLLPEGIACCDCGNKLNDFERRYAYIQTDPALAICDGCRLKRSRRECQERGCHVTERWTLLSKTRHQVTCACGATDTFKSEEFHSSDQRWTKIVSRWESHASESQIVHYVVYQEKSE